MPDVRPFRGWRYDLGRVGALSDVVAPPYDVIDPALQAALYDRHPHNVVRLILNRPEDADNEQSNRYTRAARFLRDWQREGVLRQEPDSAFYVYHQSYANPLAKGETITRRGVLTRVRLEPFGQGKIYPHEETMPGPKADRLHLMQATAMNLSPIFGLYPDETNDIQARVDESVRRTLPVEATDHLGTVSRLWPLSNLEVIRDVQSHFYQRPVFIADGHHRYETALKYLEERREAGEVRDDESPANFVLMMLVSMSDPGLLILPTHRLISGVDGLDSPQLKSLLKDHFEIEDCGKNAASDAWELMEADGSQSVLGFGITADDAWLVARLKSPEVMKQLVKDRSDAWRGLAVSVLHKLVLEKLLSAHGAPSCRFVHQLDEVVEAVAKRECSLAALVPPVTMQHVEQIAGNGEKMPPKSTYFSPKLLSGLVFNPLR